MLEKDYDLQFSRHRSATRRKGVGIEIGREMAPGDAALDAADDHEVTDPLNVLTEEETEETRDYLVTFE